MTQADSAGGDSDRRATTQRRRYNRRTPASEAGPPYYETFDRIATAMEALQHTVERLVVIRLDEPAPEARESASH